MTTLIDTDPPALAAARLQIEAAQSLAQRLPEGVPLAATLTDAIDSAFSHLCAGTAANPPVGGAIAMGIGDVIELAVHDVAGSVLRVSLTPHQARRLVVQIEIAIDAVELIWVEPPYDQRR